MKKAILLPYACYQNEPSLPLPKIYEIPDNIRLRDEMLKELFIQHVSNDEDDKNYHEKLRVNEMSNYGDMEVTDRNGDCFLFVTFLEE